MHHLAVREGQGPEGLQGLLQDPQVTFLGAHGCQISLQKDGVIAGSLHLLAVFQLSDLVLYAEVPISDPLITIVVVDGDEAVDVSKQYLVLGGVEVLERPGGALAINL